MTHSIQSNDFKCVETRRHELRHTESIGDGRCDVEPADRQRRVTCREEQTEYLCAA